MKILKDLFLKPAAAVLGGVGGLAGNVLGMAGNVLGGAGKMLGLGDDMGALPNALGDLLKGGSKGLQDYAGGNGKDQGITGGNVLNTLFNAGPLAFLNPANLFAGFGGSKNPLDFLSRIQGSKLE